MKKLSMLTLALALIGLAISSCQKEQLTEVAPNPQGLIKAPQEDLPSAMLLPFNPVYDDLFIPDLSISTAPVTNITATTTNCGTAPIPNGSCIGGQRSFSVTAIVENNGAGALPAGTLEIRWIKIDFRSTDIFVQVVPHSGIPAGGTLNVGRPYFLGPCGTCSPPSNFYLQTFVAQVDPNNLITELRENNNNSPALLVCDGC